MKKSNELGQALVEAEVKQFNIDIMSKNPNDLPNDISREFLHLQKELIIEDLHQKISEKQSEKEKKLVRSSTTSQRPH